MFSFSLDGYSSEASERLETMIQSSFVVEASFMAMGTNTDSEDPLHIFYPHSILQNDPYVANPLYIAPMVPLPVKSEDFNAVTHSDIGVHVRTEREKHLDTLVAALGSAMCKIEAVMFPDKIPTLGSLQVIGSTSSGEAAVGGLVPVDSGVHQQKKRKLSSTPQPQ